MLRLRTPALSSKVALSVLLTAAACAEAQSLNGERTAGTGGGDEGGGGTPSTSGGSPASSGGASSQTGGSSPVGSGGNVSGGTAGSSGGSAAQGGAASGGSTMKSGGATSTGGVTAKGGASSVTTPGSTLLSDDFEDRDASDWYAADMNGTRGVSLQDASYAYVMTATDKALSVGGNVTWTDQKLEAKVKFLEAANSPVIYLMARWAEAKSYIVIEFRPGTASSPKGDMKLRQTDGGSTSDLCRYKPASVLPNTWYTIGVSVSGGQGSTATLLFNGEPVVADAACTLSKAGPAAGGVALGVQNGSAAFDDVRVLVP